MGACWVWQNGCEIDWPAWVQAVGSIVAIGVAIMVDQGAARRTAGAAARRDYDDAKAREDAIFNAESVLRNLASRASGALDDTSGDLAAAAWHEARARVDQAITLLAIYLNAGAPALTASTMLYAKAQLEVMQAALADFNRTYASANMRQLAAAAMAGKADAILKAREQRDAGVW